MWEYKIIRTELGWILSRKKEMGRLMMLQYLNSHQLRTPNKSAARVFYTQGSAESALIVMRKKDEKKTD